MCNLKYQFTDCIVERFNTNDPNSEGAVLYHTNIDCLVPIGDVSQWVWERGEIISEQLYDIIRGKVKKTPTPRKFPIIMECIDGIGWNNKHMELIVYFTSKELGFVLHQRNTDRKLAEEDMFDISQFNKFKGILTLTQ